MSSKAAAFSFLSSISLNAKNGNNNNNNNNNNGTSTSSTGSSTTKKSGELPRSKHTPTKLEHSGSSSGSSSSGPNTWIFKIPYALYKTIDISPKHSITLNAIPTKSVVIKQGDQFYFCVSEPQKVDKIVALATVSHDTKSGSNPATVTIPLKFDKVFSDPVPRDQLSTNPQLSNLVESTSSFTKVSDAQLPHFLSLVNGYTSRKVKKEAMNFLSGISLAPPGKEDTAGLSHSPTPYTSQLGAKPTSTQDTLGRDQQQQQQPHSVSGAPTTSTSAHHHTSTNAHLDTIQLQPTRTRKRNTIEEYNTNYNIATPQRIYFASSSGYPLHVFSMIRGDTRKVKQRGKNTKEFSDSTNNIQSDIISHSHFSIKEANIFKLKETSYGHLLISNYVAPSIDLTPDDVDPSGIPLKYDPLFLDNSELKTGKHRTVMNLHSYKVSIFPYIKKSAIKEELNEQFRQKHEWIKTGVTLYKIRKIKRKLQKIAMLSDIEMSTLALSYVLFEKLIIKNAVNKENIKLYSSGCLLLAAKFNDPMALESLKPLIENIEKKFSINKKELLASEFQIFSAVNFGLFIDYHDVLPHFNRLKQELMISDQSISSTSRQLPLP
ncbi:hypothetical protein SAMD00019534_105380 [Acytostelium subglobosum LB1]|uniref:hypothetical protein n=1 Tax=Acytostelium subglobosum LB1 TaxID=1410327 RepID=UPI0006450638|nr:hypothetical protein SAMD00019534_105380 [Acytostelium subglobosum LB1]GAM27363.1 hypothetical protein SAMD00019534_105380 [Acytostelium subglobosum LB1]|eukprot:XP_012749830.1 hypothetical protein SAMD00019534_105380 [Acytostelium subglobosum LB1]